MSVTPLKKQLKNGKKTMTTDEQKRQLIQLKDEYFITLNGIHVEPIDGGDTVVLVSKDFTTVEHLSWEEYERQTLKNNGKICAE